MSAAYNRSDALEVNCRCTRSGRASAPVPAMVVRGPWPAHGAPRRDSEPARPSGSSRRRTCSGPPRRPWPTRHKWARPRTVGARRCSRRSHPPAVELRRGERRRRRPQDLIRPPQLMVLPLQLRDPRSVRRRGARPVPASMSAWATPPRKVSGLIPNCSPIRRHMPRLVTESLRASSTSRIAQPQLVRVLPWCCYDSHPLQDLEPPSDAGRDSQRRRIVHRLGSFSTVSTW